MRAPEIARALAKAAGAKIAKIGHGRDPRDAGFNTLKDAAEELALATLAAWVAEVVPEPGPVSLPLSEAVFSSVSHGTRIEMDSDMHDQWVIGVVIKGMLAFEHLVQGQRPRVDQQILEALAHAGISIQVRPFP